MDARSEVLRRFVGCLEGRPVRWLTDAIAFGDFEGREETIEVFDVPQSQQRRLLRDLREARQDARRILGRTVRVLFHTPEATTSLYSHVRTSLPKPPVARSSASESRRGN